MITRPCAASLAIALGLFSAGCGADFALGAGANTTGRAVGFGRVAMSTKFGSPLNEGGLMLGLAVESRGEEDIGSRWSTGLMLGFGKGPAIIDGRVGYEVYAEAGTTIKSTLVEHLRDVYFGAAAGVPIALSSRRNVASLNDSTRLMGRSVELVPMARVRVRHDDRTPAEAGRAWLVDIAGGFALRLRIFSDLF